MMSFLLGISPASCSLRPTFHSSPPIEDGTDTVFRNVGRKLQDAGEIPKRKLIINTTRRKLKIENKYVILWRSINHEIKQSTGEVCSTSAHVVTQYITS